MLSNYVQGKAKFERLNHLIDDCTIDKERQICAEILNAN